MVKREPVRVEERKGHEWSTNVNGTTRLPKTDWVVVDGTQDIAVCPRPWMAHKIAFALNHEPATTVYVLTGFDSGPTGGSSSPLAVETTLEAAQALGAAIVTFEDMHIEEWTAGSLVRWWVRSGTEGAWVLHQ